MTDLIVHSRVAMGAMILIVLGLAAYLAYIVRQDVAETPDETRDDPRQSEPFRD